VSRTIGIDIGGTGLRAATISHSNEIGPVRLWRFPDGPPGADGRSQPDRSVARVVETVCEAVAALGGADRVGAGVPGFVHDGTVLGSPNFPTWNQVPFRRLLEARLGVPVAVENDANCAALGAWHQRGRAGDLILLTLGTGVGGGAVVDGRLLRGAGGTGGEFGHIWMGGDTACGCGGVGCLETWVSNHAFVRLAAERGAIATSGQDVVEAAGRGESWAEDVLQTSGVALGRALTTFVNLFNPDEVVLCGGLTAAERWLAPPARAWLTRHGVRPSVERVRIVWEGRADAFAILGAARACENLE
jgi:glucokinase